MKQAAKKCFEECTSSGPSSLWASVLLRAIMDLDLTEERSSAFHWIESHALHIGSFVWICQMLDINPERTRAKILDGRSRPNPPRCAKPVFNTAPPPVKQHIKPLDKAAQAELIEKLKAWRANNNLPQSFVAAKLGISRSFLSDILLLKNNCSPVLVERIKDLLQNGAAQSELMPVKLLDKK